MSESATVLRAVQSGKGFFHAVDQSSAIVRCAEPDCGAHFSGGVVGLDLYEFVFSSLLEEGWSLERDRRVSAEWGFGPVWYCPEHKEGGEEPPP